MIHDSDFEKIGAVVLKLCNTLKLNKNNKNVYGWLVHQLETSLFYEENENMGCWIPADRMIGGELLMSKKELIKEVRGEKDYKADLEAAICRCFSNENFANFKGKHVCRSFFLIDLQLYWKRDSNKRVFLWTLRNF